VFFPERLLHFARHYVAWGTYLFDVAFSPATAWRWRVSFSCVIAKGVLSGKAASFRPPLRGMGHVFIRCCFFARHCVAEASDFHLLVQMKVTKAKDTPSAET